MSFFKKKYLITSIAVVMFCSTTAVTGQTSDESKPRDVEIGVGGNVKQENPIRSDIEEKYEWHAHLFYESRYISEGRDNLAGKGIYSVSTEFTFKDLTIVPWLAEGVDTNYSEFNVNIVYGFKLDEDMEIYAGYNHLQSDESGNQSSDNEISLDMAYFLDQRLKLTATLYYSFDAEGAFTEIGINKRYQFDNRLSLNIGATVGFNAGYVTDGHDGINHGQLQAGVTYQLMDKMELYAMTAYSAAIDRDVSRYAGDETLSDEFWGGAGLSYRF